MDFKKYFSKYILFWFLFVVIFTTGLIAYSEFSTSKKAQIVFLDVGQGDATLIIDERGRSLLIDAGKYQNIGEQLSSYFSHKNIDLAVATHPDLDHVGGFNSLVEEYAIDLFLHSGLNAGIPVYRSIAKKIHEYHISTHAGVSGEKIILDKDSYLEILYPYPDLEIENPNDYSVVIMFFHKGRKILLMGDASREVEKKLVDVYGDYLRADILKLGHHGSKTSSGDIFIQTVKPRYAIISAGCNNTFGHPHASVLRTLDDHHIKDLQTCEEGDIIFEFQEEDWVLQNKKSH